MPLIARCRPRLSHVWVPDDLLSASYARFAGACSPLTLCRRRNDTHFSTSASPRNDSSAPPSPSSRVRYFLSPQNTSFRRWQPEPAISYLPFAPQNELSPPDVAIQNGPIIQALLRAALPPPPNNPTAATDARDHLATCISSDPGWYGPENVLAVTTVLVGGAMRDQIGGYRQTVAADIWLTALQDSPLVSAPAIDAALAAVASKYRPRNLPLFFNDQTPDQICLTLLRFWPASNNTRHPGSSAYRWTDPMRVQHVLASDSTIDAFKGLRSTPFLSPNASQQHVQPFLDLVMVVHKQRKRVNPLYEDISELLFLMDRPSDFVHFDETLQRLGYRLRTGLRRRWLMAYMTDHPYFAFRLFRLRVGSGEDWILSPADLPGFIEVLVASPRINPKHIDGLLWREKQVCESRGSTARGQRLAGTALEAATAFASCARLPTFRARQANVMRMCELYRSLKGPQSEELADLIVLVCLLLPPLEDRMPTLTERESAQRACQAVSDRSTAEEVHLATMEPSIGKAHIRRYLEDKYGPDWATLLNIESQAEPQAESQA